MLRNRPFNIFIAIALVVVLTLTVREAFATASLVAKTDLATSECASLPSRYSIHTEFRKDTGMRLTYTEDGPTGVDGGLVYLMSAYRACSR
jgi:hypothetical protein